MQSSASPFLVNIVPLANVQTNVTGDDPLTGLSNQVAAIATMVNYDQKRIYTDSLQSYTTGGTIDVLSPLTSNGQVIGGTTVVQTPSTLQAGGTSVSVLDSSVTGTVAVRMDVRGGPVFRIDGVGNALYEDGTRTATEFRVSSMTLRADAGAFSTVTTTNTATVGGICYAQQFVTLSDQRVKEGVRIVSDIRGIVEKFSGVNTYWYRYSGGDENPTVGDIEVGLLAQELETVFPECVQVGGGGQKYIKYNTVVALLLGAVRNLSERVKVLEGVKVV